MGWWTAIPAAISAGTGLYQALNANKISDEEQQMLDYYKTMMDEGLSSKEEGDIFSAGSRRIAPVVSAAQRRGAASAAERGISGGSAGFDMSVGAANRLSGQLYGDLNSKITMADIEAKRYGAQAYGKLQSGLQSREDQMFSQGLSTFAGGVMQGVNAFKPPEPTFMDWLDENKDMIWGGGANTASAGGESVLQSLSNWDIMGQGNNPYQLGQGVPY